MSETIQCRTCGILFPRPVRRGRPPVECEECRTNPSRRVREEARELDLPIPEKGRLSNRAINSDSLEVVFLEPEDRINRLEKMLLSRGTHLSQNRK